MINIKKFITLIFISILISGNVSAASWHAWPQIWGKDETQPASAVNNISRSQTEKLIVLANVDQMGKDFSGLQDAVSQGQAAGFKVIAQIFANSFAGEGDAQALIDAGASAKKYNGEDYYSYPFFCLNQPAWQDYLKEVVQGAVETGADGFSIIHSDNMRGRCFCSSCEAVFRDYLANKYSTAELAALGISDITTFDYSDYLHSKGVTESQIYGDDDKSSISLFEDYQKSDELAFSRFLDELLNIVTLYGKEDAITINSREGDNLVRNINYSIFDVYSFYSWYEVTGFIFTLKEATQAPLYKIARAIFPSAGYITQPNDLATGGIVNYSSDPHKYIYSLIAEALACKVNYYDVHDFGLWGGVWLDWSIDSAINLKVKDFLQKYNAAFDFDDLQSYAKIAVLYSAKSQFEALRLRPLTAEHSFMGMCTALSKAGFQYDVIFNSDGEEIAETISSSVLAPYEIVIIPGTISLTEKERSALLAYVNSGGNLIAYGEIDSSLSLTPGETSYGSGKIYYDSAPVPKNYVQTASQTYLATMESDVNDYLSGKVLDGVTQTHVISQVWKTRDSERIYLHLINHDIENNVEDLDLTLELPADFYPDILYLVSPDMASEQTLTYTQSGNNISFTVPELDIWDMVIIISTKEAQESAQKGTMVNSLSYGPNPASNNSTFFFNLTESSDLIIRIYTITGELVNVITSGYTMPNFDSSLSWDLKNVYGEMMPNGVYVFLMEIKSHDGRREIQKGKIIVLK